MLGAQHIWCLISHHVLMVLWVQGMGLQSEGCQTVRICCCLLVSNHSWVIMCRIHGAEPAQGKGCLWDAALRMPAPKGGIGAGRMEEAGK